MYKKFLAAFLLTTLFVKPAFSQDFQKSINILSNSIKLKTISYEDNSKFNEKEFSNFIKLLEESYPLVHKYLKREVINNSSLVYTWQGKNLDKKPNLFLAHIDVVPVDEQDLQKWDKPPFSGEIDDNFIWGRGTLDDKVSIISILSAIETLLEKNFTPENTIYLAFGHDEEIGGKNGASKIATFLLDKKVKFNFILDEGLTVVEGIIPKLSKPAALIGIAEKGYASFELSINKSGGHSSMPDKENAITILSEALIKLNNNQIETKITPPVRNFFQILSKEMGFPLNFILGNPDLFKGVIVSNFSSKAGNALLRTTTAITIFNSGVKDNVVPNFAKATVNFRILPTETIDSVYKHLVNTINDPRIKITKLTSNEPSKVSEISGESYNKLKNAINKTFGNIMVAPSLVLAGTDSKNYQELSDNIYRFLPIKLNEDDLTRIHGTNERIKISNFQESINFYQNMFESL